MSPRTTEQFEEIREERRNLIMEVALELFADKGFSHVTIANIAQKAGISKGLLYNYFESKEQLITEIMMAGINEFIEVFDPNKDGELTHEELHFFIDETFRILQAKRRFYKLYFLIMFQPEVYSLIGDRLFKLLDEYVKILTELFVKKGYKDPASEVRFFGAMMDGISINYALDPNTFPLDEIKNRIHEMYK
jgi:AcrR family transcriptional regulator